MTNRRVTVVILISVFVILVVGATINDFTATSTTPVPVVECGHWQYYDSPGMEFLGTDDQDVCVEDHDLVTFQMGFPVRFTRTHSFSVDICNATVVNNESRVWTFTECGQSLNKVFPPGNYVIVQTGKNNNFRVVNLSH